MKYPHELGIVVPVRTYIRFSVSLLAENRPECLGFLRHQLLRVQFVALDATTAVR